VTRGGNKSVEHPVLTSIQRAGFTPFGWFAPDDQSAAFIILIGNAGPEIFRRFARARDPEKDSMDEWTRTVVDPLAASLDARAVYPFDKPAQPFLTWARKAGAGHVSPLGLNIHNSYGLWHAYRAALLFPVAFDLPPVRAGAHPCESCADKPCLSACPVEAFDGTRYDLKACGAHILSADGADCMTNSCAARRACPVGKAYEYMLPQKQFHMRAFADARRKDMT
jgi:epoxyqueuosine reductase QueG